jgi:hypothetical protein
VKCAIIIKNGFSTSAKNGKPGRHAEGDCIDMLFLTVEDCRTWLQPTGLTLEDSVDGVHRLNARYTPPRERFVVMNNRVDSNSVAWKLINWLPLSREIVVFVEQTCGAADKTAVLDTMRRGCGSTTSPLQSPGHLFFNRCGWDYQDCAHQDIRDEAVGAWVVGAALNWTWDGWIAAYGCEDFVQLGDDYIRFWTPVEERMREAEALMREAGLMISDRFPWQ